MGKSITFGELDTLSGAFAAWLQAKGCRKGTRVALMMPNILQYPVCLFGTLRAGCTVVNVNPLYTARELEHQLNDSGAEVIVVVENFAHTVQDVVTKTKVRQIVITSVGELLGIKGLIVDFVLRHVKKMVPAFRLPGSIRLSVALAEGRGETFERVPLSHDDLALDHPSLNRSAILFPTIARKRTARRGADGSTVLSGGPDVPKHAAAPPYLASSTSFHLPPSTFTIT